MASYGWTLDEALDLTFPQVRVLYRALTKWPTINLLAAGIGNELMKKDPVSKLGKLAGATRDVSGQEMDALLEKMGDEE